MSKASGSASFNMVIGAVAACVGVVVMLFNLAYGVSVPAVFGGMLLLVGLVIAYQGKKRQDLLLKNFEWYRGEYPVAIDSKGQVKCFKCESSRIHTKNLMNRTFIREHHCGQCGQSLYFSSEGG